MVTSVQTPITPTPLAGDWPAFVCQNLIGWTSHPWMLPVAVSAAVALMLRRACKHIGISHAGCIIQYFVRCTCPRIPLPQAPAQTLSQLWGNAGGWCNSAFMSPPLFSSSFSYAIIMWEVLARRIPFEGNSVPLHDFSQEIKLIFCILLYMCLLYILILCVLVLSQYCCCVWCLLQFQHLFYVFHLAVLNSALYSMGSVVESALLSYSFCCSLVFGPEATNPMQIMFSVLRGTRPDTSLETLPADIPSRETLLHLMTSGWAANPDERPSFLSKRRAHIQYCTRMHTLVYLIAVDTFLTPGSRPSVRNECSSFSTLC